jgi:hypothetical protein
VIIVGKIIFEKIKMVEKIYQELLKKFEKNKWDYEKVELWTGTQGFVREIFEKSLGLKSKTTYESFHKNFFIQETQKNTKSEVRADFILNINGIKIVVEVEKRNNIKPWIEQIERYMREEWTPYGILTDSENWYFYSKGFETKKWDFWGWVYKNLSEILTEHGKTFFQTFFNTKDYYINFFNKIDIESFHFTENTLQKDIKNFHKELIQIAEKLKSDFEKSWVFWNVTDKELIQTTYSFIIQFLLIKIIQDKKKNLELISKDNFVSLLNNENYNGLANSIFSQIDWLGKFYTSYQNQQKHLIEKISKHYQSWVFWMQLDFDAVQGFLDLYTFVYKFNFKNIKQDIFWAVYENYLKELYKDDNSKKWQVFTPPEIVDFMLDEVWYTHEYIQDTIEKYILEVGYTYFREDLVKNIDDVNFNIPWLSLIDPACWSGTFLYKAAGRILNWINLVYNKNIEFKNDEDKRLPWILSENLIINNIVGFDIEAFPLYLAEMNILQTLLWYNIDEQTGEVLNRINKSIKVFSTDDTISEFANMQDNIEEILEDFDREWQLFSVNRKRVPKDISELKIDIIDGDLESLFQKYIVNYFAKRLYTKDKKIQSKLASFSTQIELEKYIKEKWDEFLYTSYFWQEGSKAEKNTSKMGLKKSSGDMISHLQSLVQKHQTKRTKFDFVIANPPYVNSKWWHNWNSQIFGININAKKYKTQKVSWDFVNIYGWFYYLGWYLLKKEWKICFINPRDLIFKTAMSKVFNFLKTELQIKTIIDFQETKVFYDRWINQWIIVWTTSCVLRAEKNGYSTKNINFIRYIWWEDKIVFEDFYDKNKKEFKKCEKNLWIEIEKISKNDDYQGVLLIDYIKSTFWDDLCISTYPKLWKNNDPKAIEFFEEENGDILYQYPYKKRYRFLNQEKVGYAYFQNIKTYLVEETNSTLFYDIQKLWTWIPFREWKHFEWLEISTEKNKQILTPYKKYKLNWENWSYRQAKKYFAMSFTNTVIWDQWSKSAIWISKEENLSELFYLFSILNSQNSQFQIQKRFNGVCNQKNLERMLLPKIDSEIKEKLKAKLIENGEAIISLCKNGENKKLKYRDVVETRISWMDEEVIWLKQEYKNLKIDLKKLDLNAEIPEEVFKNISKKSLKELEKERDLLVYCLYFGSEDGKTDMIDLRKINIKNIFENEKIICENDIVRVIEK